MNKTGKIVVCGIITLLSFQLLTSCKKKKPEKDEETISASDNSLASSVSNDMISISDEAGKTKTVSSFKTLENNSILSSCATLKFDTINPLNPDTITVKFGSSNCTCNDGRTRRGDLIITYTGKYHDSLTVITISPQNYFVNDNSVSGSKSIKNKGHNSSGHLVYEINASLQITKASGGNTIIWNCKREREWMSGEATLVWYDDTYSITGTANGSASNGSSFSSTITVPLVRIMTPSCRRHFVSGTIVHTPSSKPTRTIDFGAGACDDQATVTINGTVYNITLP